MSEHPPNTPPEPPASSSFSGQFAPEPDRVDVREMHAPILRELSEPRDGYEPVPIWLVFLFFALFGWGGWYVGNYCGGWDGMQYDEHPAARGATAQAAPPDPKVLGKRVFNQCIACHQASGDGIAGQYPPLAGSDWVAGPPETLARILLHGLEGPVKVKDQPFDNKMPAWGATLGDEQIAAVLTHVRSNFGNSAPAVDAALVKKIREETKDHAAPWSVEELKAMEKKK